MAIHKVAKVSEIPNGTGKTFDIDGKNIAIFNLDDKLIAIDNVCKHKGGSLGDGELDGNTVTCPLHGWQYNVTNGECLTNPNVKLDSYDVKVDGDTITLEF